MIFIEFEEFKSKCEVLSPEDSDFVRECFIDEFIDTSSNGYRENILKHLQYADGEFYNGYLWDYLKVKNITKENYIEDVKYLNMTVFVMWDIHSDYKVNINNYFKFGKKCVIKTCIETLLLGKCYLPDDIYIFDENFTWYFVFTHEDIYNRRYCLKYGI